MPSIRLHSLSKHFRGAGRPALHEVSLDVASGEVLIVAGPSGSGKTTLLRLIAGLEIPTSGALKINNRDMRNVPPGDRDVAMVFQSPALYPQMSVFENMSFGLKLRGCPASEREQRVRALAEKLGISDLLARKPAELSGGQAQRVALGRALVRRPGIFLLDEPFSHLHPALSEELRPLVLEIARDAGSTVLWSTHNQADLFNLPGRVALLNEGRLEQLGTIRELRHAPVNEFVAAFVRPPSINLD